MAGKDNLVPIRTTDEARERGANGGVKSGEARREKKLLRELLNDLLDRPNNLMLDENGDPMTNAAIMAVKAIDAASGGDWKAWELVRDTAGQKPIEKVMVADVDAGVVEQIENMVFGK